MAIFQKGDWYFWVYYCINNVHITYRLTVTQICSFCAISNMLISHFWVTSCFDSVCVVPLKGKSLVLPLPFEDTDVCPRQIAVSYIKYCTTVGFVFKSSHLPLCCQKWFSTMSEFKYSGAMLEISLLPSKRLAIPKNLVMHGILLLWFQLS